MGLSSGGFYLCRTNLHRGLTPGQQGLSEAWVVLLSLPRPLTGHKSSHRGEFGFSPQNELTPPPKGGGAGYHLGWVCWGFHAEKPGTFPQEKTDTSYPRASLSSCHRQLLVTNGSHGFNRACLGLPWCRFPTLSPKPHTGPHGGEFGFGPLAGACQEDCPPFRQSRVKNRAEEKTPLPCFSKIEPVKFVIPCKRFSKPPGENPFSLFMRRRFCAATGGPPGRMLHGIFAHKQRTRPFHGRVLVYHLILWRDGSPSPARSNLYATASWMGRIVYRSTPFCTLPSLPWTVVFSVSMSLFSSNR